MGDRPDVLPPGFWDDCECAATAPPPSSSSPPPSPISSRQDRTARPPSQFHVLPCPLDGCGKMYQCASASIIVIIITCPRHRLDLKRHVLTVHPTHLDLAMCIQQPRSTKAGKIFPCPISSCRSGYTRKHDLCRHLAQKHRDAMSTPRHHRLWSLRTEGYVFNDNGGGAADDDADYYDVSYFTS